jgi:hypothetical protein
MIDPKIQKNMHAEFDRDGALFQGLATTVSSLIGLMLQGGDVHCTPSLKDVRVRKALLSN